MKGSCPDVWNFEGVLPWRPKFWRLFLQNFGRQGKTPSKFRTSGQGTACQLHWYMARSCDCCRTSFYMEELNISVSGSPQKPFISYLCWGLGQVLEQRGQLFLKFKNLVKAIKFVASTLEDHWSLYPNCHWTTLAFSSYKFYCYKSLLAICEDWLKNF